MSKLKALLFDLDGTLLNTLVSLGNCFNRALVKEGFPTHPSEAYRLFIGDGARVCVNRCLPIDARDDGTVDRVLAAQQADYLETWHQDVQIYEGIDSLLSGLKDRRIPIAVLSNKDDGFVQRCVEHFFPRGTFLAAQGFSESVPHKPDPTGARRLVECLNMDPGNVALLGDTAVDITTAEAAGIVSIGALWGFRDRNELVNAGAKYLVENPDSVLDLF